jgi:predicted lipoprotein with Yx(FWY)xxD motif
MRFTLIAAAILGLASSAALAAGAKSTEDYVHVPMPPGFQVINTELEGNVFADARGRTLYDWPVKPLRVGSPGDPSDKSTCTDEVMKEEGGHMSPYPPGLLLPDVETRPTCVQMWPPVLATDDSKPIGNWDIVTRPDGLKQWAYAHRPLYTFSLDRMQGDTNGGTKRDMLKGVSERPAARFPVEPPPSVPPGFDVISTVNGRMLVTAITYASVYTFDKDTAKMSACEGACLQQWSPMLAPEFANSFGEWSLVQRSPGILQWAFRGKPLYTHVADMDLSKHRGRSLDGSDVPGWNVVYVQVAPEIPNELRRQATPAGEVLADKRGRTIYLYYCQDDADDQLPCDHPDTPQDYRLAVCGGGDANRCLRRFPLVLASANAKSTSRAWSVMEIMPLTGRRPQAGEQGAVRVWAYRDRPLYTFDGDPPPKVGDREPGDIEADGLGEKRGMRNGYSAFWLRDDLYGRTN